MAMYAEEDVCVAFSGGVDSSLLLAEAVEAAENSGNRVYAVTFQTKLHPATDLLAAEAVAEELGVTQHIIVIDELAQAGIEDNPKNRCYLCKRALFARLKLFAERMGAQWCLDGTNADDLRQYRPGLQALAELHIESPLAELGFSKAQVRALAKERGLSVAQRPSTPCMATRLPYGAHLDYELLKRIDRAEAWLRRQLGGNVRLRLHGDIARIEVDAQAIPKAAGMAEEIVTHLKALGFVHITLDLRGFRSGSMDE